MGLGAAVGAGVVVVGGLRGGVGVGVVLLLHKYLTPSE